MSYYSIATLKTKIDVIPRSRCVWDAVALCLCPAAVFCCPNRSDNMMFEHDAAPLSLDATLDATPMIPVQEWKNYRY